MSGHVIVKPSIDQSAVKNRLLRCMSSADFDRLAPKLELVHLEPGFVLAEPDEPIEYVYFLDSGVGAIIAGSRSGPKAEIGVFGSEGFAPCEVAFGATQAPHEIVIHLTDAAWRVGREALQSLTRKSPALRDLLFSYVSTLATQTAYTALSAATDSVEQRLARWILMCCDRVSDDEMLMTHLFMSIMLSVRRPSITNALHVLEGEGWIRSERGRVTVKDHAALAAFVGASYGKPEAEYERLMGPSK